MTEHAAHYSVSEADISAAMRERLRRQFQAAQLQTVGATRASDYEPPDTDEIARRLSRLSLLQFQVLICEYEENLNKTIADRLGISVKTVELHRARMMDKMKTVSVSELIRMTSRCREVFNAR